MRLRWTAMAAGGVVLAAAVGLLRWGGLFDDRRLVVAVLNHAMVAEESLDGFKEGLAALGYPEERRVIYHYRGPVTGPALEAEAKRLADLKPDLFLSLSTPAAKAALAAARPQGTPLVFAPASDPVASGLVDTLGRPGRNATGVTFGAQEPLRLQWLKTLLPDLGAALVPYNPDDASPKASLARIAPLAAELGVRLDLAHVRNAAELDAALAGMAPDVGAVFVPVDAFVASQVPRLVLATLDRRIPLSIPHRGGVVEGAFMSYGLDMRALGEQAARLAARVFSGVPAGDLPVETAEFRLAINMEIAGRLGIRIADPILRQAEMIHAAREDNGR